MNTIGPDCENKIYTYLHQMKFVAIRKEINDIIHAKVVSFHDGMYYHNSYFGTNYYPVIRNTRYGKRPSGIYMSNSYNDHRFLP